MFTANEITQLGESDSILSKKGIYLIHSRTTGKDYIGCTTKSFYTRWTCHIDDLVYNRHHNSRITNLYNNYTVDDLVFIILEDIDDITNILIREQYYINKWNPELNIGFVFQPSLFTNDIVKFLKPLKTIGVFKKKDKFGAEIYVLNKRLILGYFIDKQDAIKAINIANSYFTSSSFTSKTPKDQLQFVYSFYGFLGKNIPTDSIKFLLDLDPV